MIRDFFIKKIYYLYFIYLYHIIYFIYKNYCSHFLFNRNVLNIQKYLLLNYRLVELKKLNISKGKVLMNYLI